MLGHHKVIGCERLHFKSIPSTNNHLTKLLSKTTPNEGIVISTSFQTQGKGQIGRYWHSKSDKNILFSTVIYPTFLPANAQWQLSMMVALAVKDYLVTLNMPSITIKWPNDIYIGHKKIAGILIENSISTKSIKSTVIGIGLNLNQVEWPADLPNPTSLGQELGMVFSVNNEIEKLLTHLDSRYKQLRFTPDLHSEYVEAMYLREIPSQFESDELDFEGTIININTIGQLLIKVEDTVRTFNFREVKYLGNSIDS